MPSMRQKSYEKQYHYPLKVTMSKKLVDGDLKIEFSQIHHLVTVLTFPGYWSSGRSILSLRKWINIGNGNIHQCHQEEYTLEWLYGLCLELFCLEKHPFEGHVMSPYCWWETDNALSGLQETHLLQTLVHRCWPWVSIHSCYYSDFYVVLSLLLYSMSEVLKGRSRIFCLDNMS